MSSNEDGPVSSYELDRDALIVLLLETSTSLIALPLDIPSDIYTQALTVALDLLVEH